MCAQAYIRFIAPFRAFGNPKNAAGFFRPAYDFRNGRRPAPGWLRDAIAEEIAWFCDYLPVPHRFGVVTRKSQRRYAGICWFRDDAHETLRHAYNLAALVEIGDVPVTRVIAYNPGNIVYRDAQQVVAIPRKDAPITFH
ncbi:MAG: hypothetical protein AAFY84_14440 [Pseudomonadota bacterium]